jgi:hypothetical protein
MSLGSTGGNPVAGQLKYLDNTVPSWRIVETGKPIVHMLISILAIAAGVGLLFRKKWARWLTVAVAVMTIPLHVSYVIYDLTILLPAQEAYTASIAKAPGAFAPPPGFSTGQKIGIIAAGSFWTIVALVMLVCMVLPATSEALEPPKARRRPREFDDETDDDDFDENDRDDRRYESRPHDREERFGRDRDDDS